MDHIDFAIKSNRKFSLSLLVNGQARLSVLQLSQGFVTYEDAVKSICIASNQATPTSDIMAHAGLLYEAVFTPSVTKKGLIAHKLAAETIGQDGLLIERLLKALGARSADYAMEEMRREAFAFQTSYSSSAPMPMTSSPAAAAAPQLQQPEEPSRMPMELLSRVPDGIDLNEDYRSSSLSRIECEKSEPIVRLLAQVRKIGMDILFPQITHDKILACIFAAIKSAATPAHRELIDMVMLVKESRKISQLQGVSKTKVRGVLALLKHGDLLITHGAEGNPVRLFLAKGINSFKDLRERHDAFLLKYMLEHHLFMPGILKSELVWSVDEDTRLLRLEAMNRLAVSLQLFYNELNAFTGGRMAMGGGGANDEDMDYNSSSGAPSQGQPQGYSSSSISMGMHGMGMGMGRYDQQPTPPPPPQRYDQQQQQQQRYAQYPPSVGPRPSAYAPREVPQQDSSYDSNSSWAPSTNGSRGRYDAQQQYLQQQQQRLSAQAPSYQPPPPQPPHQQHPQSYHHAGDSSSNSMYRSNSSAGRRPYARDPQPRDHLFAGLGSQQQQPLPLQSQYLSNSGTTTNSSSNNWYAPEDVDDKLRDLSLSQSQGTGHGAAAHRGSSSGSPFILPPASLQDGSSGGGGAQDLDSLISYDSPTGSHGSSSSFMGRGSWATAAPQQPQQQPSWMMSAAAADNDSSGSAGGQDLASTSTATGSGLLGIIPPAPLNGGDLDASPRSFHS